MRGDPRACRLHETLHRLNVREHRRPAEYELREGQRAIEESEAGLGDRAGRQAGESADVLDRTVQWPLVYVAQGCVKSRQMSGCAAMTAAERHVGASSVSI